MPQSMTMIQLQTNTNSDPNVDLNFGELENITTMVAEVYSDRTVS